MELIINEDSPGISDVSGFELAGVHCDVRETGDPRLDLALVFSATPCTAAGVFTSNDIKAAPVKLDQTTLAQGNTFHGIITNSGNANACTGAQGVHDALSMRDIAAEYCGVAGRTYFVCSTGRIGRQLPMETIRRGIQQACLEKSSTPEQSKNAAQAILTSDTRPKTVTVSFTWNNTTITIAGMAKGAGMIEPNMATMLAYIATDAHVSNEKLQYFLSQANETTFNAITVDGDMSTNDTVLCLANGASGIEINDGESELGKIFQQALHTVCESLAKKIVSDGEKVTKCVTLNIQHAPTTTAAQKVARAIGNSLLVKSSWYGNDPNWGRIMDAAGYARIGLEEDKIDLYYNDCPVIQSGQPILENLEIWKAIVSEPTFSITLNANLGPSAYRLISSDLSTAYVDFNKSE